MRREEKGAVVRYTKVVGVRGVDRGLGYNMGTDKKLPKGRGILRGPISAVEGRYRPVRGLYRCE
jgi:hypothetical protein